MAQEQYQQGQGQMGMSQGPFSQYLQGYAQQPYTQAQPGISPAAGAASIATQVLQHMRNYRIQDYMMKEQQRERQENAYHTAIMMVQGSGLSSNAKQRLTGQLMDPFIHTIAGEKDGPAMQASGNPIIAHIKQFASNLIGGNVNKQQVGNFDTNGVMSNIAAAMADKTQSADYEVAQAHEGMSDAYARLTAENKGTPVTGSQMIRTPEWQTLYKAYSTNNKPVPSVYGMGFNLLPGSDYEPGLTGGAYHALPPVQGQGQQQGAPPQNQLAPDETLQPQPPASQAVPSIQSPTAPVSPKAGYAPQQFLNSPALQKAIEDGKA